MARQKKQRPPGPKPGELPVTYSDMVTLLLTFFVFLMSMAEFDVQRLKDFLQAMGGAFGIQGASGAGVLHGGAALTSETSNLNAGSEPFNPQMNSTDTFRSGADTPGEGSPNRTHLTKSVRRETKQIEVSEESRQQFERAALQLANVPGLEAEMTNQGLKITLEEQFTRFESGSADLPPEAIPRLRQVIQQLKPVLDQGYEIVISGHTDNVPPGTTDPGAVSGQPGDCPPNGRTTSHASSNRWAFRRLRSPRPAMDPIARSRTTRPKRVGLRIGGSKS
ncbi:MAG: hypothetical protein KatS3mg115_1578 [Candidatus Poribacteria bacterium]|nr:MAG: hypothetical protein KatS3mg115_1578 [Candidatus Poribacteria bacterium]